MDLKDVLKQPIITEKSTALSALGRYTFEVNPKANKREIARAVATFFGVKVKKVWVARGFKKQKKALIQLAEGEKIDLFKTGD